MKTHPIHIWLNGGKLGFSDEPESLVIEAIKKAKNRRIVEIKRESLCSHIFLI